MLLFLLLLFVIPFTILTFCMVCSKKRHKGLKGLKISEETKGLKGPKGFKGVALFDIDGTLKNSSGDMSAAVSFCLENGFAVGICTASDRTIEESCAADWMPKNLCNFMIKTNYKTFHSRSLVSGVATSDFANIEGPREIYFGMRKGLQMQRTKEIFGISDPKLIVLFDDMACYIKGAKKTFPRGTFVCSGQDCHGPCNYACATCGDENGGKTGNLSLSSDLVIKTIENLI